MTKIQKIVPENHEKSTGLKISLHNFKSNPMGYPENLVTLSDIVQNIICVKNPKNFETEKRLSYF